MLKKLLLRNFQQHKKLEVEFDPRVTCLVGRTAAGKSSVIRALRAAAVNKMAAAVGTYVRHGQPHFTVDLFLENSRVRRRKGKRVNLYYLDKKVYKAFGQAGIPDEIAKLVNMGDANFQRQLDSHFWFADSAGQVSKKLNEIVNLDLIDKSLALAGTRVRQHAVDVRATEQALAAAEARLADTAWVPRVDRLLQKAERAQARLEETRLNAAGLKSLLGQAATLTKQRIALHGALLPGKKAILLGARAAGTAGKLKALEKLIAEYESLKLPGPPPDIGPLLAQRAKADRVAERCSELEWLCSAYSKTKGDLCRLRSELARATKKLGARCPTCGSPVASSQSSAPISTSATPRPRAGRGSRTGTRHSVATCGS